MDVISRIGLVRALYMPDKLNLTICGLIDLSGSVQKRKTYRGDGVVKERLKIKRMGKTAFSVGKENLDLRYVEQLVDEEQTQTLAYLLRYAKEHYGEGKNDVGSVVLKSALE